MNESLIIVLEYLQCCLRYGRRGLATEYRFLKKQSHRFPLLFLAYSIF
jgi:hypothetical protein